MNEYSKLLRHILLSLYVKHKAPYMNDKAAYEISLYVIVCREKMKGVCIVKNWDAVSSRHKKKIWIEDFPHINVRQPTDCSRCRLQPLIDINKLHGYQVWQMELYSLVLSRLYYKAKPLWLAQKRHYKGSFSKSERLYFNGNFIS